MPFLLAKHRLCYGIYAHDGLKVAVLCVGSSLELMTIYFKNGLITRTYKSRIRNFLIDVLTGS
jgi:hypothetical protein